MIAMILVHAAVSFLFGRRLLTAREALLESEERRRFAREAGHVGVWDLNPATLELRWTPELEIIYGVEHGSVGEYRDFAKMAHPDDIEALETTREEAVRRRAPFSIDFRILRPDGETRWVRTSGRAMYDREGKPTRILGVTLDITELRQTQTELLRAKEEAEKRAAEIEALMDGVPAMVMISRDTECRSITGNRAACEFLGMPAGANLSISAPQGERPTHFIILNKGWEIPPGALPLRKAAEGMRVQDYEMEFLFQDGRSKITHGNAAPLRDSTGRVYGAIAAFVDITERKRSEEALRQSEEKLALATAATGIGIFDVNFATNDIACTDRFACLVGFPARGKTNEAALSLHYTTDRFTARVHHEDRGGLQRKMEACRLEQSPLDAEYRIKGIDGEERWVNARGKFYDDGQGEATRFLGVLIDITGRKRMEETLKALTIQLRERLGELQTLLDTVPAAIWIAEDPECRYITGNKFANSILNVEKGTNISRKAHPGASPVSFTPFRNGVEVETAQLPPRLACATGKPVCDQDMELRFADGRSVHLVGSATPLFDLDGRVRGSVTVAADVTRLKAVENELRKSGDRLEVLVRKRTAELESANERLRSITARLIEVQENERKRLASDLHDTVGQTLAALKFRIELVAGKLQDGLTEDATRFLNEFVPVMQRSIDETRTLYMGLRPPLLADHGISATLDWYRRRLMMLYPKIHIELEAQVCEEDIREELKIAIFRIAQEGLNNACKHSNAEWVDVRLFGNKEKISLEISDEGSGMNIDSIIASSAARSLGLLGMKERTELTGGDFTVRSAPDEGATILAVWEARN